MKQKFLFSMVISLLLFLPIAKAASVSPENDNAKDTTKISNKDKLVVVWTSGDKEGDLLFVDNCKTVMKPQHGDCCIYCSYGS